MATRGVTLLVPFIVWDTNLNEGKTGDAPNLTMRWRYDGTTQLLGTPSEISAGGTPGLYEVTVANTYTDVNLGVLHGVSSSSNVSVIPVLIQFERLPDAAPNAVGGVNDLWGISGSTTAAQRFQRQADAIEFGATQASGLNTITLQSSQATDNLDLTNMVLVVSSGLGRVQTRRITAYDSGTKVATVDRNWEISPSNGDEYVILGLIL